MDKKRTQKIEKELKKLEKKISESGIKFNGTDSSFVNVRFNQFESPFEERPLNGNFSVTSNVSFL